MAEEEEEALEVSIHVADKAVIEISSGCQYSCGLEQFGPFLVVVVVG